MKRKRHGTRYPWDKWLVPGKKITLHRGKDFDVSVHGMAVNIRVAARRMGLKVSVYLDETKLEVRTHHA